MDDGTHDDPLVARLTAALRVHADTVASDPAAYGRLRREVGRARRRTVAVCAASLATLAVTGGIVFTSYGNTHGNDAPANDNGSSWRNCAEDKAGFRDEPTGALADKLQRAVDDYVREDGHQVSDLVGRAACQVDYWAHGSDDLSFRIMWQGEFATGGSGVILRIIRGNDAVDFLNTSHGSVSHPAVASGRVEEPASLVMRLGRSAWAAFGPPGSTVELREKETNRLVGVGLVDKAGYAGITPNEPVPLNVKIVGTTVAPDGGRRPGPFEWRYGEPEECRVLFRNSVCPPDGPTNPVMGNLVPAAE
ncbi:hypothetical protein [Embleya sp. NPDC005575]|uniref:hypothetical protein n=1 Tax=Embleya sp. NPDC005575 TaxID=3156892 RepID=UPI0033A858C9